jgi:hypothetical protein
MNNYIVSTGLLCFMLFVPDVSSFWACSYNPSRPSLAHIELGKFILDHEPDACSWLMEDSGFVFNLQLPVPQDSGTVIDISLDIYNDYGDCIASAVRPDSSIFDRIEQWSELFARYSDICSDSCTRIPARETRIHVYWNGFGTDGSILDPGPYRAVIRWMFSHENEQSRVEEEIIVLKPDSATREIYNRLYPHERECGSGGMRIAAVCIIGLQLSVFIGKKRRRV